MFERRIPLFNLFGFKVGIDITWFILAVLITWSLAKGLFPHYFEGFSNATYWWMGAAGALGLFVSIVFHEFCHSIVARSFGLPMKGITLFIFGGIAEMNEEPESPKSEFFMAVVGPVSSVVLGGIFYLTQRGGRLINWPEPINAVLLYLAWINVILAGFNLVPAFPLDGGRILRSILWATKKNLRWATRIASGFGSAFGIFLIVLGVMSFIAGNFIGGLWYFLIGMFIRSASQMSYQQLLIRKALSGEQVERFMKSDPVSVPPSTSIAELVDDYFYKYHYKMFPISENGKLEGCISIKEVKQMPKDEWAKHSVKEISTPCSDKNTISPDADAIKALSVMKNSDNSRLMVVEGDELAGIITLKDMLKFLSLKVDLEEDERIKVPEPPPDEG
jgi:Zn-dependent protease/predicted transcriptional regulator